VTSAIRLEVGGEVREVIVADGSATLDGTQIRFREIREEGELVALEIGGEIVPVRVVRDGERAFVWCRGRAFEIGRARPLEGRTRGSSAMDHGTGLVAPMPGRIRRISVPRGESVAKGDVVLVLEAMKMEHAIRAPRDGVVTRLEHREGDLVDAGAVLAEIS
jgi:acetyl/propionyl-CoA carboxylase alpha subunit